MPPTVNPGLQSPGWPERLTDDQETKARSAAALLPASQERRHSPCAGPLRNLRFTAAEDAAADAVLALAAGNLDEAGYTTFLRENAAHVNDESPFAAATECR